MRAPTPRRLAAPACAAFLLLASGASAAPLAGGIDAERGNIKAPELDIVAAAVVYDPSGIVRGAVTTAAPATPQVTASADVLLGKSSKARGTCDIGFHAYMWPDAELGPFGGLYMGDTELGEGQEVVQNGQVMMFDSTAGNGDDGPVGPLQALAGQAWDCAVATTSSTKEVRGDYADADDTGVFPVLPGVTGVAPSCGVVSTRVRRGGRLRVHCVAVGGAVTVRLHRKRPRGSKTAQLAPDGAASVKVRRKQRRGGYVAAVWQGPTLLGSGFVRVR